ncbi:MAG: HD-like signal output (HDOD) protein [Granulosicoccus sp.]|jgi:HD-like signal output (HDOD) protein
MTKIVLIDEDIHFVSQMAKLLSKQRPDWWVESVNTAAEAMDLLESMSVDVVVSDASLPDMEGAAFLERIRSYKPNVLRFTLSDDQDAEILLECARLNQRFIAKPADAKILAEAIDSSIRLRNLLAGNQLSVMMQDVDSLPAIPALYNELVKELASPKSSLIKVAEIIEADAGLTLSILKIVNSAYFGLNQRVDSVAQAISLLGTALVKNITLTSQVFSKFEGSNVDLQKLMEINNQALKMGALTNQLSRHAKVSRISLNHCQVAGMMSNIGELIALIKSDHDFANAVPSHLLGAYLMKVWMMPDAVTEAIAMQHEPISKNSGDITPLVVLHSIQYMQNNFTDTSNEQQRRECSEYLNIYLPEHLTHNWLDSYQAIEQLIAD